MKSKRPFRLYPYIYQHQQAFYPCWKQLIRHPLGSLTTILVIGLAWALPAILLVIFDNLQQISPGWQNSTQISVYLKTQTTEHETQHLLQALQANPAISKTLYVSPQEGLQLFSTHSGFKSLLGNLKQNPLPPVILIQPTSQNPQQVNQLVAQLQAVPQADFVKADITWLQRFFSMIQLGKRLAYLFACLFSFGVLLLVAHTVHLATQEQRKEIEIYQLVGATDHFIRRPFLYMGMMYGFLGALTAFGFVQTLLIFLKNPTQTLAFLYQSNFQLQGLTVFQMLFLFITSISLSWLAAWIAVQQEQRHS